MVLPYTHRAGAVQVAERIGSAVAAASLPHVASPVSEQVDFGMQERGRHLTAHAGAKRGEPRMVARLAGADVAALRAVPAVRGDWFIFGLIYDVTTGLVEIVALPAPIRTT
jgi:hypothetical protein